VLRAKARVGGYSVDVRKCFGGFVVVVLNYTLPDRVGKHSKEWPTLTKAKRDFYHVLRQLEARTGKLRQMRKHFRAPRKSRVPLPEEEEPDENLSDD